jgi:hypothetical protein
MADAVTSQIVQDGQRQAVCKFTNVSDGTGEAAVVKVHVASLVQGLNGDPCTGVSIEQIWYNCDGMSVSILWDATTDIPAAIITGYGHHNFTCFEGLTNNAGAGKTGDILFTTNGATSGDSYTIVLKLLKNYG